MKLDIYENKYVVFLNKDILNKVDFKIKKQVETCFKEIFAKIKRRINKDINGFFSIKVYLNNKFGAIVVMEKENLEYYDYFSNQIDMQIEIDYASNILLKIEDIFDFDLSSNKVYLYNNNFYVEYVDNPQAIEFGDIVYGEEADAIASSKNIIFYG